MNRMPITFTRNMLTPNIGNVKYGFHLFMSQNASLPDYNSYDFNYRKARFFPAWFNVCQLSAKRFAALPTKPGFLPGTNQQAHLDEKQTLAIKLFHKDNDLGLHIDGVLGQVMVPWLQMLTPDPHRTQAAHCLKMAVRVLDQRSMQRHGYNESPNEKAIEPPALSCTREDWIKIYDDAFNFAANKTSS